MNIRTCFLILFVLLFSVGFIGVGSAESGTITVTDEQDNSYSLLETGCGGAPVGNNGQFYFHSASWNYIKYLKITSSQMSFTNQANSGTFTISSGGTGTGTIFYDKDDDSVTLSFDGTNGAEITAANFVITMDSKPQVLTEINAGTICARAGTPGEPVSWLSGGALAAAKVVAFSVDAIVSTSELITYIVTYDGSLFTANISKAGDMNTKTILHGSSSTYFTESTFNTVSYNMTDFYDDGLYINATLSTGSYNDVLINSTGTGAEAETEVTIDPTTGAGIIWNETEYYPNDYAELLYEVEQATWDEKYLSIWNYEYWLKFYRNGEIVTFPQGSGTVTYRVIPARNGTFYYTIADEDIGTLTAVMVRCSWVSCSDELATASTTVKNFGDSWIGIPPKVKAGLWGYFNISFIMGTQLDFNRGNGIKIYYLNPTTDEYELESYVEFSEYSDLPDPIVRNTLYEVIGTTTNQIGQYKFVLYDFLYGELAEAYTESISYKIPSNLNLSVSYIEMPQTAIQYGDWFYVKSGIDTANYTNSSNQFFYSFYNDDISSETSNYAIPSQLFAANYRATSELTSGIDDMFLYDGNNTIRLIRRINGTDTTLASVTFTVSSIDPDGYGLKLFKSEVCNNEIFTANIISPTPSRFMIIGVSDGIIGQTYYNQTINSTYGTTKEFKISVAGDYLAILTKSDGTELTRIITVTNCAPTVTETPIDTAGRLEGTGFTATGYSWMDNLLYFMSLSAFWGFILFIVVVIVVATNKQASPALGYIAFVVANIEAIIGLWAPFTMYILVLTWVFAGIYFVFGRKIISGL